ncbi:MAG: hypothetical protein K8S98_06145 [Planctomycetes bacterium]|nr:hypothetical protein [Planctomycetota bacterium]
MDLPIRQVEIDRTAQVSVARKAREEQHGEAVFELDPNARRRRDEHRDAPKEQPRDEEEQRIAPRSSDEVGSHLDVTA